MKNVPLFLAGYRIIIFGKCTDDNIVNKGKKYVFLCSASKNYIHSLALAQIEVHVDPVVSPIPFVY